MKTLKRFAVLAALFALSSTFIATPHAIAAEGLDLSRGNAAVAPVEAPVANVRFGSTAPTRPFDLQGELQRRLAFQAPSATKSATHGLATVTSVVDGAWSNPATWGGSVPTSTDDVVIADGTTVTIDTTPITVASITVGQGASGILVYNATTANAVTVTGNVVINANAAFTSALTGTVTTHSLTVGGSLTNNGTFDLSTNSNTAGASLTFNTAGSQTFGGTGTRTNIRTLIINKVAQANILELNPTNFTVQGTSVDGTPMAYLTLTAGTLKISGAFTLTGRTFTAAGYSWPVAAGFWLNNPNYTVAGQNGSPTLTGLGTAGTGTPGTGALLRISAGTFNIGTASGNSMGFGNNSTVIVEGGAVNATGRFGANNLNNNVTYTQTGGTITVCTVGQASTTLASFDLGGGVAPDPIISSGTIICQRPDTAATTPRDFRNEQGNTAAGIVGGTVQFGNAQSAIARTFRLAGNAPNVVLTNTVAGHTLACSIPSFFNNSALDVTINSGTTFTTATNTSSTLPFFVMSGTTFTNNGTVVINGTNNRFIWTRPSTALVYQGTGTATGIATSWEMSATGSNLSMNQTNNLVIRAIRMFAGGFLNANKMTLGDGTATVNVVQVGNGTSPSAPGTFDAAPTFNLGTGGENALYARMTGNFTTGPEIPPARSLVTFSYDDTASVPTFHSLTVSGGDITAATTLALTNGHAVTGLNKIIASGTVTRTTGFVDGNLQKPVTTGASVSRTFEVGSASGYSPATVLFASVTGAGNMIAKATGGDHPNISTSGINPAKSVNRYYTLTNSGIAFTTASETATFLPADVDAGANTANFITSKYDSPNWTATGTGTRTATTTQATGITSFSDFQIGEAIWTINSIAGSGGTISPSGAVQVADGGSQTFTITPGSCAVISDVIVDGVSQGAVASYTFTNVTANHSISCSFAAAGPYTITANAGPGGLIAPSGAVSVACGGTQGFGFMPASCFVVADVVVDGVSQGPLGSYTFTNVTANHTIDVSFTAAAPYTITSTAGSGGTIAPLGATSVACGGSQAYAITASGGFTIQDVMVDGVSQGAVGSYTFTNVQANHTIDASFSAVAFPVVDVETSNGYNTIQAANDDPATLNGHHITVAAGTYNERVTLSKSLSILGAGETLTILDGTGLPGVGSGIAINTGVTNVTIRDLTVKNYAGNNPNSTAGIYGTAGNNGLTVQNVTLKDNVGGCGFYANGPVNGITLDNLDVSGHTNAFGAARGIVVWNGLKENISITNCDVYNNNCCGIELQDGDASGVTMTNNNVHDNGDNGIGVVGLEGPGENVIASNTLTNNGRFGIEVKNSNGSGAVSGPGRIVVENNTVSRTAPIVDARDIVGIASFRRGVLGSNVDVPTGTVIRNNIVSGYTQPSVSEGFGIVAEGTNHTVTGNTVSGCDVGIQRQYGHLPYPGDGDQSNVADTYFGRGNSPVACDITVSGNTLSNSVDTRDVPVAAAGVSSATLAVTVVGSGTVTKTPDQPTYGCSTTVTPTLTATPDPDWHFTGWSGDASGSTNPLTVIMDGNKSITATFAPNTHVAFVLDRTRATASSTDVSTAQHFVGTGSWHEVYPSAKEELYISPSADLGGASFTVNDIQSVTYHTYNHANVSPTDFFLAIYTAGSAHGFYEQRLNAEPYLKTGQPYVPVNDTWNQWSTIGADQLTFNDTNNSGNQGFYTQPTLSQIQAGPITWSTYPGNPGPGASSTPINYGPQGVALVSFQTGSGWSAFDGYLDGISIALKSGTTYDVDLEAYPYNLTVNTVGSGTVAKSPDQPSYAEGAVVQLTATPAACWTFSGWSGDATGNANPLSLTMDSDKTVTATFVPATYTILASAGANGSIAPSGSVVVTCGGNQAFTITANGGYVIQDVLVDAVSVGAVSSYTFTNVTADHTISASFTVAPVADITSGNSFTTIQGAINDATTLPGDIIVVQAGTFTENVTVSKAVTLRGAQSGVAACGRSATESIILAANPALPALTIPGGNGIVVDGFTIDQNGGNPGGTHGSIDVTLATATLQLLNNRVLNFQTQAIWFQRAATDAVINGNSLNGSAEVGASQTLFFSTNSYNGLHLTNNCITGGTGAGVFVDGNRNVSTGVSNPVISGNTLSNNAGVGMNAGSRSLNNTAITGNTFANNAFDGFQGGPSNGSITGNTFSGNGRYGLALTSFGNTGAGRGAFALTISGNNFSANGFTQSGAGYFVSSSQPAGNVATCHANDNDIVGNFVGATYAGTEVLDVGCNWWGNISGPNYSPSNTGGTGDKLIATNAQFSPWLNGSISGSPLCNQFLQHTITATAGAGGTITPSGAVSVADGSNQAFTIAADGCHTIADVLVDGVSVGAVTSYTFVSVTSDHTIAASFNAIVATVNPVTGLTAAQVKTGNDADGTTKITLTFTAPGGAASVEVWSKGFGSYPTYDDGGGSVPPAPGAYPPAGWTLTGVTASGQTDEPATRDFWYYVAYAKDACGNVSVVSNETGGTLDYHLGDVTDGSTPGQGNNSVNTADISLLGAHYGVSGGALAGFEYLDVGPTTDHSTNARPTTDNVVNFEDLVMFALNFTPHVSLVAKGGASTQAVDAIELSGPTDVKAGDVFEVPVDLTGSGNLQALSIKLGWDATIAEPIDAAQGDLTTQLGGVMLSPGPGRADVAALGAGNGLRGQGTIVTLRFRAIASGNPALKVAEVTGRNGANENVQVTVQNPLAVASVVKATDLQPVIPNPVRGHASLNYSLVKEGSVDLSIYSVDGRRVKTLAHGIEGAGRYNVTWNGVDERGASIQAGVYFVRFEAPGYSKTRLITLIK